jgi:hypothetical protein
MNKERRGCRAWIAAGAVGLGMMVVPVTAVPANAGTPNCVSRAEFRAVHNGWSQARVARVFDIPGRSVAVLSPYRARVYNDCWRPGEFGFVSVFYKYRNGAWRVVDKTTQFWHP